MNKQKRSSKLDKQLNKTIRDIKQVKIQGARNIAKAALKAYHTNPTEKTKEKLIKARPTEPMLANVLNKLNKENYKSIQQHFDKAQTKINKKVLKLIKNNDTIFNRSSQIR